MGGVSRPKPRGVSPGTHLGGVSRPTPGGVSRHTPRGVSQHALRQTPPPHRRLLLQAVRILLECILVVYASAHNIIMLEFPVGWRPLLRGILDLPLPVGISNCHIDAFTSRSRNVVTNIAGFKNHCSQWEAYGILLLFLNVSLKSLLFFHDQLVLASLHHI